jgi:hypothetical protein
LQFQHKQVWNNLGIVKPSCIPSKVAWHAFFFLELYEDCHINVQQKAYVNCVSSWSIFASSGVTLQSILNSVTSQNKRNFINLDKLEDCTCI